MFEEEELFVEGERIFILNKGNTILSAFNENIYLYEKQLDKSTYELIQKFICNSKWAIIYLAMLSDERIIASGRKFINIFKKDNNSNYILDQDLFLDWAEITKIKELKNKKDNFAVSGWYGLGIFEKQNDKYINTFELECHRNGFEERWIIDFMEIEGKERGFVLCGERHIFIIQDKNLLNKFSFEESDRKSFLYSTGTICQFRHDLFLVSGERYITLINTSDNQFKKIDHSKKELTEKEKKVFNYDISAIYKYDTNSIIVITRNGLLIFQIFDIEKIQLNIRINFGRNYFWSLIDFIEDERAIYLKKRGFDKTTFLMKLNKKLIHK